MDDDILRSKGFHPSDGNIAVAKGYGLRIGEKATLVQSSSECSYGIVMKLSEEEINSLYSAPGVSEYVPEQIEVTGQNGSTYKVICYNLPLSKLSGSNREYAKSLSIAARKMGLPDTYVSQILAWAE